METRRLNEQECKSVYTLNTWTAEKIAQAKAHLDAGYYVHMGSTAIGHTCALMTENAGIKSLEAIYGDRLEVVQRDGWGDRYCHLI